MSPNKSPPGRKESALLLQQDMKEIIRSAMSDDKFSEAIESALVRGWRKRFGTQRIYIQADPETNGNEQIVEKK